MTHALRVQVLQASGARSRCAALLWLLAAGAGLCGADAPTPFDTTKRVQWTTSQVHGTAEPPAAYHVVRVYPKLTLESPVDLRLDAAGQRWYVLELNGTVRSFPVASQGVQPREAQKPELVLDIGVPGQNERFRRAAYGLVLHPRFAENGQIYVFYRDQRPGPPRTRISRFTVDVSEPEVVPRARLDSETVICEFPSGEDHFGGSMAFGPDGFLYFSVGDGSGYGDGGESGQDLGDFQASIHRIDVDHPSRGRMYSIPAGNPFTERLGARPEIWAYGVRNIWRMAFDRRHRRPVGRRRRPGPVGVGVQGRARRQLRLVDPGGHPRLPPGAPARPDADPAAGDRARALRVALADRRPGLPRQAHARARRRLHLRRLRHRPGVGRARRRRQARLARAARRHPACASSTSPPTPTANCCWST